MKKNIVLTWNKISDKYDVFRKFYKTKIHNKKYMPIIYGAIFVFLLLLIVLLNIIFMKGHQYSLKQIFGVLNNWNDDKDGVISSVHFSNVVSSTPLDEFQTIQRGWYNIGATLIAGIGMTLAAIATQSLTKNPIAEGSTLGLVQAGIFGAIFALSYGMTGLASRYLWVIVASLIGASLLLGFVIFARKNNSGMQKIILAGLAIGIIFKTLTFIFKSGNQNNNTVSFAYVLGGAESISGEPLAMAHDLMNKALLISTILVSIALVLSIVNIKGMNLLEIGDERAKNLGSSVMLTRIIDVLITLLALPAAVILVGNMAFLGLFSVHLARWVTRSRNYKKVLPTSIVVGMLIASIGLQLTEHMPKINSGIWMTFIGAPYLIYIGIKGLK